MTQSLCASDGPAAPMQKVLGVQPVCLPKLMKTQPVLMKNRIVFFSAKMRAEIFNASLHT
jgi:hypothetical protein